MAKVFTVIQLNQYIKYLFEKDLALRSIWVQGEVSNFKKHSSGHLYFTLKDSQSAINCVMFKSAAAYMKFQPENGMQVLLCGRVSLYEKTGQYQIYVDEMQPDGKGTVYMAFEQLKKKLSEEGLFDISHKKSLPKYPSAIGIITSPTGAAVRDIIKVSKRRNSGIFLVLCPVLVQGEDAPRDIVRAVKLMNEWNKVDLIILGRGGGSIEDLQAFNNEEVARAVYASEIPIISAVGHEIDFTITDFVADVRAATPSAAAEIAVPSIDELLKEINVKSNRMYNAVNMIISDYKYRIDFLENKINLRNPVEQVYQSQIYLERLQKQMKRAIDVKVNAKKTEFLHLMDKLEAVSPLSVLKRGYTIVYDENMKAVKKAEALKENDFIKIQFQDDYVTAQIKSKGK